MSEQKSLIERIVQGKLNYLMQLSLNNPGQQKASLAELRRGIGHKPGELPKLWGMILEKMPEKFLGERNEPSKAEWAVYTTMTLFAWHQMGHDMQHDCMHQDGISLGKAMVNLVQKDEDKERIIRRWNIVATSRDMEALSYHLRGTVQLLRREGIAMDYVKLANDLYCYQNLNSRAAVVLQWGREFYKQLDKRERDILKKTEDTENE